ncbi:MAG: chemotaxis protein CheW, partial [Rhodospirillaceae bacterium]
LDALPAEMVVGEFPWRQRTVLMLNADRVGLQEIHPAGEGDALGGLHQGSAGIGSASAAAAPAEIHHIYVLARSGPGMFALPVEQVAEVVPAGPMTRMPGAPAEVIGITQLRGRPLPVLMPAVLATDPAESGTGVLMVINATAGRFALRVDSVAGIRRFPLSRIHAGAEAESGAEGRAGYLIDSEQRVIGLLDADRMTAASGAAAWRALLPPAERETLPTAAPLPTRKLLLFRVGAQWCGFDAASVVQLTGWRPLLPVPDTVTDLAGLIEIGADVLPVIDLRVVMNAPVVVDEWTTLIILHNDDDGSRWVAVSDRIDRLVTVPAVDLQCAEAPPHPLIAAVARVGDRMVSVLDAASLFRSD